MNMQVENYVIKLYHKLHVTWFVQYLQFIVLELDLQHNLVHNANAYKMCKMLQI